MLTLDEAVNHPHNKARKSHTKSGDIWQPSPAPVLSRTPGVRPTGPASITPGTDSTDILAEMGYSSTEIKELVSNEAVISSKILSKI